MLDLLGWGRVSAVVVQVRRNLKGPRQGKEGKSRGFCICAAKRLIIDVETVRRWLVLVGSRQGYIKRRGEKVGHSV